METLSETGLSLFDWYAIFCVVLLMAILGFTRNMPRGTLRLFLYVTSPVFLTLAIVTLLALIEVWFPPDRP
jgi:hypothetical protein